MDVNLDILRFTWQEELTMLGRLVVAVVGGAIIGYERHRSGKDAGVRTLTLVSIGAALFTIASVFGFEGHDSSRIAAGVVTGIGFLGAGAILRGADRVHGLTTAASIWITAAIGVAAGAGLFIVAIGTAVLAVIVVGLIPEPTPVRDD